MASTDHSATAHAARSRVLFGADFGLPSAAAATPLDTSITPRIRREYAGTFELPPALAKRLDGAGVNKKRSASTLPSQASSQPAGTTSQALVRSSNPSSSTTQPPQKDSFSPFPPNPNSSLIRQSTLNTTHQQQKPQWQPPWKLMRVLSGHLGWVRALAVEPDNQWFATGAGDRTIKIWDLASGTLKLTLTGHISAVRGLAVSPRHPYLFSCGEDKMVKCWDLETNKVIRHYHGHLSGVYTLALHPTLDVLVTGGRDGAARVWDMRTRSNIHVLSGHKQTVSSILTQEADPQVITGSLDSTVRLWDLAAGKSMGVLTHHKKGVRALASHPNEFTFASASTGSVKQWKCPEGALMQNFDGHNSIINALSVNEDGVMMSGGDDGSMCFWDWTSGHLFQRMESVAQPGSLDAEAGIMASCFDRTGLRLITGEADKTVKIWRQDENATEETHPLDWKPSVKRRRF